MHATAKVCDSLTQITFTSLPVDVIHAAKQVILDGISVAVAGAKEPGPTIAAKHARRQCESGPATLFVQHSQTNASLAAYVNGISMHVLDYEPMWSPPTHATSPTLPAILALAQEQKSSGRDIITAFVRGCELQGRLRLASGQFAPGEFKVHPPGSVGPLGAAVACGHLLRLRPDELQHALGIAASRAGGLMANVGTMAKATHCGWAAMSGLDAALLASDGFTANKDILEAPNGYIDRFYGKDFNYNSLSGLGESYRMVDPGFVMKLFPCQYGTHFGISAALEIHKMLDSPSRIQKIHIIAPIMPYVDRPKCETGLDGKFSFQYTVAAALLDGKVGIRTFDPASHRRRELTDLITRTTLEADPNIPRVLENMWVEVIATLQGGKLIRARCDGPIGFWDRQPLEKTDHLGKVKECLGLHLTAEEVSLCIQHVDQLETLEAKEVSELMRLLS